MADPEETSSSSYRDVVDGVAGLTGTAISTTGDIIDIETGGRLGGRILGPVGIGVDGYFKTIDEDGFTVQDGVSLGGGFIGGFYSGVLAASWTANPWTIGAAGVVGGFTTGFAIDSMKFGGTGPLHEERYWNDAIQDVQNSNAPPAVKAAILRDLVMAREIPSYRQEIGEKYGLVDPLCFPAATPIAISLTETRPISDIRLGDTVLAFDPAADLGRGALVPRKVVRLYQNTTEEWVKLTWAEDGEAKELIATPGHHFLDRFGSFPTIEEMLENGRATVVLASGELAEVTAERIIYSSETAHLFEQAQAVGMIAGNAALKRAERISHSSKYFATKVIALIISTCLSSAPARADESFSLRADQVSQVLSELRVDSVKPISELITGGDVRKVCLVSTDTGIEVDAGGCDVNSPSLVAVSGTGQCSIVDLSPATSRILSGSIDVECRSMSPSLALTKIDRFGQAHIVFLAE